MTTDIMKFTTRKKCTTKKYTTRRKQYSSIGLTQDVFITSIGYVTLKDAINNHTEECFYATVDKKIKISKPAYQMLMDKLRICNPTLYKSHRIKYNGRYQVNLQNIFNDALKRTPPRDGIIQQKIELRPDLSRTFIKKKRADT